MNTERQTLSNLHLLVDFYGAKKVEDPEYVNRVLCAAAKRVGITVLTQTSHRFTGQGLTAAVLLADGHVSLHTWPEYDYIAMDIFLRGSCRHEQFLAHIQETLEPQNTKIRQVFRERPAGTDDWSATTGKPENENDDWFWENTMPGGQGGNVIHSFNIQQLIYRGRSALQDIFIFENQLYGRMLALDGIIQLSDSDEFIYNEMLVHSVLLAHPSPRRILLVGGGSGGALRECLRHDVDQILLVEIDKKVIDVCRVFFPHVSQGSMDDPRVEILIADAQEIIKDHQEYFDVVIVDSSDSTGPSESLYGMDFYQNVYRALKPDGMVTLQVGSLLDRDLLSQTHERLGRLFPYVTMLRYSVASFNCGACCFMLAGKTENPGELSSEKLRQQAAKRLANTELRFYSPEIHSASQLIPAYLGL